MSRLIDADNLIELIDKEYPTVDRQDMKMVVSKAPTAYDVDKVVMDLENASYCKSTPTFDHPYTDSIIDLDEAIDIVKRGGVYEWITKEERDIE